MAAVVIVSLPVVAFRLSQSQASAFLADDSSFGLPTKRHPNSEEQLSSLSVVFVYRFLSIGQVLLKGIYIGMYVYSSVSVYRYTYVHTYTKFPLHFYIANIHSTHSLSDGTVGDSVEKNKINICTQRRISLHRI